jgi:hypothetical protein
VATVNNNANIPKTSKNKNAVTNGAFNMSGSDSLTLPAGTYYFNSFSMSGNTNLILAGPVIIYCTGDFNAGGGSITNPSQKPRDFQVYCTGSTVSLHGGAAFCGMIYAPTSDISRSGGSTECYGALIGKTLTINGSSGVHFDQALAGLLNVTCQ